jgi:hypothetical protein
VVATVAFQTQHRLSGKLNQGALEKMRARHLARPAYPWLVVYFDFVSVVLFFLRVLSFTGFESSSRTVSDAFAVSIL